MTTRLETTDANADSAAWSPSGETLLQMSAVPACCVVDVQTRVEANAPWLTIASLSIASRLIERIAKVPELKLSMRGNPGGVVKVWSDS